MNSESYSLYNFETSVNGSHVSTLRCCNRFRYLIFTILVGKILLMYYVISVSTVIFLVIKDGALHSFAFIALLMSRLQFVTGHWLCTQKDRLLWPCLFGPPLRNEARTAVHQ